MKAYICCKYSFNEYQQHMFLGEIRKKKMPIIAVTMVQVLYLICGKMPEVKMPYAKMSEEKMP